MAVAIRKYASAADLVLDRLVYRSAGIFLLNKYYLNEDYSSPQIMFIEWRCHSCGFISNEKVATCESGTKLRDENIKDIGLTGFSVDIYSSPSTDISTQMLFQCKRAAVGYCGCTY